MTESMVMNCIPWGFTQKSRILEALTFNASGRGVSEGNPQVHSPVLWWYHGICR